jgi:hypothetical protein
MTAVATASYQEIVPVAPGHLHLTKLVPLVSPSSYAIHASSRHRNAPSTISFQQREEKITGARSKISVYRKCLQTQYIIYEEINPSRWLTKKYK